MIEGVVWRSRLRALAVPVAILAGSQLGHAVAYYARYGLEATSRQSEGVHWYLPTLAGALSAGLGVLLMTGLLVIAAARSLGPQRAGCRTQATLRFSDLLPALFATQLLVFAGQETIENLVAGGGHLPSPMDLLLWGTIGQLPAAVVAAGVLTWLLARLEAAWTALLDGAARVLSEPPAPAILGAGRPAPAAALRLAAAFPPAFRKRGPPLCWNQ